MPWEGVIGKARKNAKQAEKERQDADDFKAMNEAVGAYKSTSKRKFGADEGGKVKSEVINLTSDDEQMNDEGWSKKKKKKDKKKKRRKKKG